MKRLLAVLSVIFAASAHADVKLPAIFSDHMVIQAGKSVNIWGWASPGESVMIWIGNTKLPAAVDAAGNWKAQLPQMPAGKTLDLTVTGNNKIEIKDILVGEVWLCSGQSNMAMQVSRAQDFDKEKAAGAFPQIRMFTVQRNPQDQPQTDCKGMWVVCSPQTLGSFSATAYFFGREIHKTMNVPVGLINSSVGGTPIEAWTSLSAQQATPALKPVLDYFEKSAANYNAEKSKATYDKALEKHKAQVAKAKASKTKYEGRAPRAPVDPRQSTNRPACLFNGMIAPLVPYCLRGAIWYQGEHNAGSTPISHLYGLQLATQIADWRTRFGQGDFPYGWVQLPNFQKQQTQPVETTGWVIVQEQMLKTLAVPHTGMAITIDIGMADDIHPTNKQEAGRRLSLWALHDVYGRKDLVAGGPTPKSSIVQGDSILVAFDQVGGGLKAGGEIKGFAIAAADRKFIWADAQIVGEDTVKISSPRIKDPKAVRYDWASNPIGNLRNSGDLPAGPFRTDDWPLETQKR